MRALCAVTTAALLSGAVVGADLKSGPQAGASVPGPFEPLNLNGPDAGDECCLFCKYGNAPVVMVFAPKPSEALAKLARGMDAAADAANKTAEVGACLIVTDMSAESRRTLGKLADEAKLKHVILAVIDPAKVKDYDLSPDAAATVLLYSKRVVRSNRAFKPADLTDDAITGVLADVSRHFSGQ
jgi:hypothetical protein